MGDCSVELDLACYLDVVLLGLHHDDGRHVQDRPLAQRLQYREASPTLKRMFNTYLPMEKSSYSAALMYSK